MRKQIRRVFFCLMIVLVIAIGSILSDKYALANSLIRFHVVANSDTQADQDVKLLVRDAVIQSIQRDLENVSDAEQAKRYLQDNLPKIETLANTVLKAAGFEDRAVVSLAKEAFPIREYDTFTLPSGVYEALRIVIGDGAGHNWWCVTFPSLCIPATSQGFVETASQAGMPEYLPYALVNDGKCEIRFFLLDMIGRIENSVFTD